ncbi:MAG: hypothetical protein CL886_08920 [Dehalococcoidia bacterium]|nr:hypothetical protein [Dehalococcoidia bacterium]|tara:strand:+ start:6253 stop:6570 length:318 start_codon:yes stop_codon:yes gene_type:complete
MNIFEKILDSIYLFGFILMIPIGIYGFSSATSKYEARNSQQSWYEETVARDKAALERGLSKVEQVQNQSPLQKGHPPPPQLYQPGDNDFNLPLQQLLEGNHGRLL